MYALLHLQLRRNVMTVVNILVADVGLCFLSDSLVSQSVNYDSSESAGRIVEYSRES
jgi:hypothetical protein